MANQLSEAQKQLFMEQSTSKNLRIGETVTFVENSLKSIQIPKGGALTCIGFMLKGTFTLTHASKTTYTAKTFAQHHLLSSVRLKLNNGFNPFNLSGIDLNLYTKLGNRYKNVTDGVSNMEYITNVVSSGGASNSVSSYYELPLSLNKRDFIGAINTQAMGLNIDLEFMFGSITSIMTDTDITVSNIALTVVPVYETFSLPLNPDMIPAFNKLKIVTSQRDVITSPGVTTVKLPLGLTYRKLINYFKEDANYTPLAATRLNTLSIVANQSDTQLYIPANHLSVLNTIALGVNPLVGSYLLDFSDQGIPGYGGGRDYKDSEFLSEFWEQFNIASLNTATNEVITIAECIATF